MEKSKEMWFSIRMPFGCEMPLRRCTSCRASGQTNWHKQAMATGQRAHRLTAIGQVSLVSYAPLRRRNMAPWAVATLLGDSTKLCPKQREDGSDFNESVWRKTMLPNIATPLPRERLTTLKLSVNQVKEEKKARLSMKESLERRTDWSSIKRWQKINRTPIRLRRLH